MIKIVRFQRWYIAFVDVVALMEVYDVVCHIVVPGCRWKLHKRLLDHRGTRWMALVEFMVFSMSMDCSVPSTASKPSMLLNLLCCHKYTHCLTTRCLCSRFLCTRICWSGWIGKLCFYFRVCIPLLSFLFYAFWMQGNGGISLFHASIIFVQIMLTETEGKNASLFMMYVCALLYSSQSLEFLPQRPWG